MQKVHRVYFDHASTTPTNSEVLKTYIDLLQKFYANSESLYQEGYEVSRLLEKSRAAVASLLHVLPNEIIYTSGSSEANSLAIKGVAFSAFQKKHLITSQIEHSSVLNSFRQLEKLFGYEVTYLPVNQYGVISITDLQKAIRSDTLLVSLMYANNETGAIQPIDQVKEIVKKHSQAYFHCDATQAIGKIAIDTKDIDLLSISAHKIEGLKGSGILVRKQHVPLVPIISGGEQEFGLRGGTSNACTNIVFAKTLRLALEKMVKNQAHITLLHDQLIQSLSGMEKIILNSYPDGLKNIVNFSCQTIPSEVLQNALDQRGFMVSARSTCESHSNNPSYVLQAMGRSDQLASSSIRVSFDEKNTLEEVNSFIQALKEIIQQYG